MNCPLCKKILLELEADNTIDFICSGRIIAGTNNNIPYTLSHFEWRSDNNFYLVQLPPYELRVCQDATYVYKDHTNLIMTLSCITKENLSDFGKNYKQLAERVVKLIAFS